MPADYQVARPVQAPNYVQMYSEGIKGALEPYNYLLNMQKELSDEDYRKAEIQNFLDEHQDKANALAEESRSHRANESMAELTRQLEARREGETERHDQAQEGYQDKDLLLRQQTESEVMRHNQAQDDLLGKEFDLRSNAQKYTIEEQKAKINQANLVAQQETQQLQDQQNDNDAIADLNSKLAKFSPEQIWNSNENPEVQSTIDAAISKIKTGPGRQRLDEIIGPKTSLGREIAERKELNGMSTDAKNAFHDYILKAPSTDKDGNPIPSQIRFDAGLDQARQVQGRVEDRKNWTDAGLGAYRQALNEGKSDQEAHAIGRGVEIKAQQTLKSRLDQKPNPAVVQQFTDMIAPTIPKKPGEDDAVYRQRAQLEAGVKAAQFEEDQRLNPEKFKEETQALVQPNAAATSTGNAGDFVRGVLTPSAVKPGTVQPSTSPAPNKDTTAPVEPLTRFKPLSSTDTSGGGLLPASTPQYAAASGSLSSTMRSIFGAPLESDEDTESSDSETA
jgi:hypothetical protein